MSPHYVLRVGAPLQQRTLVAESGVYELEGSPAALRHGRRLIAEPGAYALTGMPAGLRRGYRLNAESGLYTLSGSAVTLGYSGAAAELVADVRWQTGTLLDGAGSNNTASSDILRDAGNALKAGDAIGTHNCSSTHGWWNYLAVTPPDYATWLDSALYPYTSSNIFWHQRQRRGCGHCVFSSLFPVPEGGEVWAWTYDEIRVGTGNIADYTGNHPHCLFPIGQIEAVHGGWSRQDQYTNATMVDRILYYTEGIATPQFIPKAQQSGDNPIPTLGYTWYRKYNMMAWDSATEFRAYKRIARLPAEGGAILADTDDWYQQDGSGVRLTDHYALGNRSTRHPTSADTSNITDLSFGNGQGANAEAGNTWDTYGDTLPLRIGVAGFRAGLMADESAFLEGIAA